MPSGQQERGDDHHDQTHDDDDENLDDGTMWPTAFGLLKLTSADETRIGALLKQAAS